MKFVTYATVRDEESLRVLSDLGVSGERILFTADESWAYDPKNALRFGSIMNKKAGGLVVALNLIPLQVVANVPRSSKEQFETEQVNVQIISGIVSCLESLGVVSRIFFLSMSAQDSRIVSRLRVALKGRVPLEVFKDLDSQYLALGQSDVLIGMRMHTIIMAAQMNVPPIALALLPKVRGVMNELGLSEYIVEALPFHEAQFQNAFSRALQDRPRIREKLETRAKDFMQRASLNTKIISRLLNETSPGVRKRW
jgi:polysaccharide pyruvyl transferase WcaK-like protein